MVGIILLADGFEETEALACVDVLKRADEKIILASMNENKEVAVRGGYKIIADELYDNVDLSKVDYLIIPGGPASFKILNNDKRVEDVIDLFIKENKLVASICAAPHLIGRKGYFNGLEFTVHPGFEDYCIGGKYTREKGVVTTKNFISAKSMYYSIDFALAIIEYLYGKNRADEVKRSCMGE